ncbi:MAG: hypothetical protein RJA86_1809, partial [Pseudomonadota bacterium]
LFILHFLILMMDNNKGSNKDNKDKNNMDS